ncbi:YDG domain-containing protein [Dyella sp.]|uniref:YDG domain-containing protein n=1 Tax=Dyella sp. TaxID=1869338 RepID=UPI002D76A57D|nr:YDG domain-containing protein [Dyella sp.]HET7330747.1 YDG domain-containing protein [Dyella sp.]
MNLKSRPSWNRLARRDIALSESNFTITPDAARRHTLGRRVAMLSLLATALGMTGLAYASGGPTGGQIVGGSGQIQQIGNTTTIHQNSSTLSLNWQSFNIGPDQTVNFVQPGSNAIAINRIFASTPSEIYGHLNANGQVWLINPNGVLFGQSAQVNVGGLVASTLDVDDSTLDSSNRRFSGSGKGSIVNRGSINAANGGYVALIGNQVSNQGVITAQLGTVALGGGSAVTLTFNGNQLLHLQVDQSTLNNLAENRQLIVADGGRVIMTAGAKDTLLASVVNNSGRVQAQTVQNHDGTITLLGGMEAGTVNVGGTLDASAPNGGKGGFIETSAAQAHIADGSVITTKAVGGKDGTWLVDPTDFTIAASGGDITATNLQSQLANGNVTFTSANGAGGTSGNVNVNQAVTWSANTTLTLTASNNVNLNAAITNTGASGKTVLNAGNAFVNNVGASGLVGNWAIYSASPTATGENLGGLTPGFIQYNAPIGTAAVAGATGNGVFYSVAPTLSVSGLTGAVSKTYDGTTSATLANGNFIDTGLINGDKIGSAAGTYSQSDVGCSLTVTSPSSIAGFNIVNGSTPVYGYALSGGSRTASIGQINPAQLTASIIGNPTKVYDGTTTATLNSSNYLISGFAVGQSATVNQPSSIAYANADAGSVALNATFTLTNFVAGSGTKLSNYILPPNATGMGTITQAPVLLSGLLANGKVYDGTTTASLNLSNASIFGVISQDAGNVTLNSTGGTGNFASANAGNGIAVNVSGFTLTGTKANDYQLIAPTDLTANITPKVLTVSGVTANNKVYDGTTADTLNFGSATLNGIVGSDNVALSGSASGTFSQSDVGNNLAVSVSGFGLTGTAAGNYTVTQPSGLIASITPRHLAIAFNGSPAKIYDGTDNAVLGSSDFIVSGFVGSESAVVSQSPAVYASPNAGVGIGVTATLQPSDFTVGSGTKLSNYSFDNQITGTGTINPAPLVVSIANNPTKVYDSTTAATLAAGNYVLSGLVNGESITFNGPTTGTYASANAGVEAVSTTLSSGNFTAGSGTLLSNYALPTSANGFGTITPAAVGVQIAASINKPITKVYDGTDVYLLNVLSGGTYTQDFNLTGFQGSDSAFVNANITGHFASKNVGNQPFSVTLNSSDFTFTSGSASNYTFPTFVYTTGSITPAPLTVSLIGNLNKVYDGSTVAQLTSANFQASGFVAGEGATITPTATFSYANKNAGSGIGISGNLTANNYTPSGSTLLSNYTLATSATGTGNITQAPLFVTGVYATNKVYDTTASDTLNVSAAGLSGLVAGDVGNVTLNTSTSGTFAQSNVGNGIAVTANGFSISGTEAANYILQPISGLAANITPKGLTISGVSAVDKVYDGTTADTLSGTATLNGVLGSDNVTLVSSGAGGTFSTANVGNNLSVSISGFTLGGAQAGNYTVAQPGGLTASITPRQLTAAITGSPTKVYDGSDSATLTAGDYTLTGFVSGQGASIPQSATAHYGTSSTSIANAGTGLSVYSTLVVSDFVANAGTNLANYILPTNASGNNGVINPYVLNLTGTRVYDATTGANASLFGSNGVISTGIHSETVNVSGSGVLVTKNVGSQRAFSNLGSLTLGDGTNGGLASNYTLVGGTDWVTITPALLTVSGTVAASKVYDNNTNASLSGSVLNGVLGSDAVTLGNDTAGTFATKNVGNGIAVSTNMSISGTDAGNYIIQQPTGVVANITPLAITVTATGTNRQYNGSVNDTVTLAGTLSGDQVTISDTSSTFADANVGNGKTVTVSGISLSGASAGNYTLNNTSTTTTADITPKVLNLTGTRVYDANTDANANLFGSSGVISTGIGTETVNIGGSGTVSSKNVGVYTGAGFGLGTLALSDGTGLASNYTLVGGTDKLTITKAALNVTGTVAANKTYDGTTAASLSGSVLNGVLGSDNVVLGNDTAGTFATKNVGTGIAVSTSMTVSGSDIGNYTLTQPTGITADITPLHITVTATGSNRVYNGGVNDAVTLAGTLSGDQVTISDTSSTFADANVGNNKTVTVSGISLGGASAGNYVLDNTSTTTTANITPLVLNLSGTRVYDAGTDANANLFGTGGVISTGVGTETVNVGGSGIVSSKNVGSYTGANFNLNTLTLSDGTGLAGNYTLVGGSDTLTITKATLTVGGTVAANKVYDGNTVASLSGSVLNGVLGSDNVTLGNASTGTFANKDAGTNIAVGTNMTIGGTDVGNYILQQPTGVTANITPVVLNLTGTRVYDANTDANANLFGSNGVLTGVNGETVNLGGSGTVSSKNVGSYAGIGFGLNTLTLSNGTGLAGNYTLVGGTDTLTITKAPLTVIGTVAANKIYDGNTTAQLSGSSLSGLFAGDDVTLGNDSVGSFASKNAGTSIAVSTAMSLSGADIGNYSFSQPTGIVANITPVVLNLSGTRVYDALTDANASLFGNGVLAGVNGETVNLSGSGVLNSKNVGTQSFASLGTLALSNGTGLAGNYTLVGGVDSVVITPATLTVSGTVAADKTYDGNTVAQLSGSQLQGVLGSDNVTLGNDTTGTFATPNAGSHIAVSTGMTVSGTDAGNYVVQQPSGIAATINPFLLNLNGTRVYDANTDANANLFGSNGVLTGVNGQTVNLGGSGIVSSKNVGSYTGANFNVNTLTLSNGTGLAANYTLVGGTDTLGITPATLTVIGTTVQTRQYDGTTTAQLSGSQLQGVFGGDNVTLGNDTTGTFASPNAASNIAVSTGMTVGGGDVGNYVLTQPGNLTGTIVPHVLDLIGTRVYDGLTDANANLFGNNGVLSTGIGTETVNLSGSGVLTSKHVGTRGFANRGTLVLSDGTGLASNYTLVGGTDQVAITPRNIVVDATGHDKTYDGSTTASVTLDSNGVLVGDVVNFHDGAANFSTPNAGSNVSIAVTGITASGADAGDYAFNGSAATSATINPYVLSLTSTRVYDGTTGAAAGLFGNNGVLTGVNGETVDLAGTGVLTSKNVGSQRAFSNLGSLVLGNGTGLASNYTLAGGSDWVSITPATLTVVGTTTTNRVYDGTRVDALNGSTLSGVFGNDDVVLGNDSTGLFVDKNVGNGKSVATAMTISGGDVGNYILMQPVGLFANVTPMPIVVTATGTNRMYNGKTDDVISLSTNGVLAGDQVALVNTTAQFADPYVGNSKTVTVGGIAAVGADAANYLIVDPVTTTTANITSAGFNGSGVQGSWIAQLQAGLEPAAIATPYGSSDSDTVGVYTGNHQLKHRPIERNRAHSDFHPGLSLQFQNGGVRLPADASP